VRPYEYHQFRAGKWATRNPLARPGARRSPGAIVDWNWSPTKAGTGGANANVAQARRSDHRLVARLGVSQMPFLRRFVLGSPRGPDRREPAVVCGRQHMSRMSEQRHKLLRRIRNGTTRTGRLDGGALPKGMTRKCHNPTWDPQQGAPLPPHGERAGLMHLSPKRVHAAGQLAA
jgi:hypothetical protein